MRTCVHTWKSKGNFLTPILSFQSYTGSGNQTVVTRLLWQRPFPAEPSCWPIHADFICGANSLSTLTIQWNNKIVKNKRFPIPWNSKEWGQSHKTAIVLRSQQQWTVCSQRLRGLPFWIITFSCTVRWLSANNDELKQKGTHAKALSCKLPRTPILR